MLPVKIDPLACGQRSLSSLLRFFQTPELARSETGRRTKRAGQRAVIIEPAGVSDFGDGAVAVGQEPRGRSEARLHDQLIRCHAKNAFDEPREPHGWKSGVL